MGYKLQWKYYTTTIPQAIEMFKADQPKLVSIDTETTGLNIIKDKPFLFIVAWKVPSQNLGKVIVLDYEPIQILNLLREFKICEYIIGANTKYDLHMLRNGGSPFPFEILNDNCNLTDVRIMRRLTLNADANKNDDRLALKQMAVKLIDENANANEKEIAMFKKPMIDANRKIAKTMLAPLGFKLGDIEKIVKDCRYGVEALPNHVREVYEIWLEKYGYINYYDIYKAHPNEMKSYAATDGILTLELFLYLYDELVKQTNKIAPKLIEVYKQENKLIKLYYKQEEVGIKVDLEYLKKSKQSMLQYIKALKSKLYLLLGAEINENQHKELIAIFKNKFGLPSEMFSKINKQKTKDTGVEVLKDTLDKSVIKNIIKYGGQPAEAAKTIQLLRRFSKWVSTYVDGVYKKVIENGDGRYHPSSDQCGTVSGRISGNMQQNPRDPLIDSEGNEVFHPRKAYIPSGGEYQFLVMQDFDQMELRVQAHYTVQFNCTDTNMCKIFVPYNCRHKQTNELYDFDKHKHIYNQKDNEGNSMWYDPIDMKDWVPIDPHGMHVVSAFGYDKSHPDFKHLRSAAKSINFSVNYGSGLKGLFENDALEDYPNDVIEKIYNAYKENFKGVTRYQKLVSNYLEAHLYITNMYGRVYTLQSSRSSYKCANYLIQGSCADLVKQCLIKIDEFLNKYNCKSRVLYTIHDEIIWELHRDEGWIIKYIEQILNETASWCKIPLTCGTDLAYTNWADKKDISNFIKD